jgi:hypothetical protein
MDNYLALLILLIIGLSIYYYCEIMLKKDKSNNIEIKVCPKDKIKVKHDSKHLTKLNHLTESKQEKSCGRKIKNKEIILTESSIDLGQTDVSKMSNLTPEKSIFSMNSELSLGNSFGSSLNLDSDSNSKHSSCSKSGFESNLSMLKK